MTQKTTFPAGTYYIGDLCYCLPSEKWMALRDNELNGLIYYSSTAYGDGSYTGSDGNEYFVDSGTIGICPVCEIKKTFTRGTVLKDGNGYHIHTFDKDFIVDTDVCNGIFKFGDITIDTYHDEEDEDREY